MTLPAHFPLSPSKSYMWLECPASKHAPPSASTPAAEAGTIAHAHAETTIRGRQGIVINIDLLLLENEVYADARPLLRYPYEAREIAAAASTYADFVAREGPSPQLELKLAHPTIDGLGGTIDCLFVGTVCHEIVDLKTGKWPVHWEQLACYALLAWRTYGGKSIEAVIVQPRAIDGRTVQSRCWDTDELAGFEDRVAEAAASEAIVPGEWCRFATCRATCEAGKSYAKRAGWPPATA